jgi:parvulin-like peptidyl-prolyl isomerase
VLLAALSAGAQDSRVVAVVNGEEVTAAKIDLLWELAGEQGRAQFDRTGGKQAFLRNYVRSLLLLQEAVNDGYERPQDVPLAEQTVQESALLDRYIQDVIVPTVVTDQDVRKFYDDNPREFLGPERARVRQIFISTEERSKEEARELLGQIMVALHPLRLRAGKDPDAQPEFFAAFAKAATELSEDAAAGNGGDIGWVTASMLEPRIADVVFKLSPGTMSGMITMDHGIHLILVEDTQPPAAQPFAEVAPAIREFLLSRSKPKIAEAVAALAGRLSRDAKVELFPDNLGE